MPSHNMNKFKNVLASSKNIIAVAGAGLSAASGIPTFRGAGGFWRKFDAMSLATPGAFEENPSRVWQFYHYRREKVLAATPNAAHYALARFSLDEIRNTIAPGSKFTLITQNVDGLSQRALDEVLSETQRDSSLASATEPAQPRLLEMHGRLMDVLCTSRECRHRERNTSSPICTALAGTEKILEHDAESELDIPLEDLPRCSRCGALARPGVVWFEEMPWYMDEIDELVRKADLCLVVGTSSTVQPAGSYANEVKRGGGKVAVFNVDSSYGDSQADFLFLGPCEETLPEALGTAPTA